MEDKQAVLSLTGPKHIKIYKLNQLGLPDKEIAALLGTNTGHVYNVLKDYKTNPQKAEKANSVQ